MFRFFFFSSACLSAVLQAHRERERWMDETISRQLCCFITLKYHSGSNSINGELVFIQLFHRLRYFFFFRSRRATRRQRDQWVTFVITHMTRYGHSRKKKQSNMNVFENLKWQKSWSRLRKSRAWTETVSRARNSLTVENLWQRFRINFESLLCFCALAETRRGNNETWHLNGTIDKGKICLRKISWERYRNIADFERRGGAVGQWGHHDGNIDSLRNR